MKSNEERLGLPPYVPIFLGLREHMRVMGVGPADLGTLLAIHLACSFQTGVYYGCAQSLAGDMGSQAYVNTIQKSLQRLRDEFGFINYPKGVGSRGAYPILINKYIIRSGPLNGYRLNAFATTDLNEQMYESRYGDATEYGRSNDGGETVVRRTRDAEGTDRWTDKRPYQEYLKDGKRFKKLRIARGVKNTRLVVSDDTDFDEAPNNIPAAASQLPDDLYACEGDDAMDPLDNSEAGIIPVCDSEAQQYLDTLEL